MSQRDGVADQLRGIETTDQEIPVQPGLEGKQFVGQDHLVDGPVLSLFVTFRDFLWQIFLASIMPKW